MKKTIRTQKLESAAAAAVHMLGILLFVLLCGTSLIFTRFFSGLYDAEIPYNQTGFFPVTALGAVLLAALSLGAGRLLTRREESAERSLRLLLAAVMLWLLAAGFLWIRWSASTPVSDQQMVYTSACRFLEGNYGRLDYGKYLYYYPFQLGLVSWEMAVLGLSGTDGFQSLQTVNVLCILLFTYAGYRTVRYLSKRRMTAAVFLLLTAGCVPLIVYSVYVYSDIPALTLCIVAIWQLLRYLKDGRRSGAAGMTAALTAAVLVRNNSLIVMIAILCVLSVKGAAARRWQYFCCAALLLFCCLGSGPALEKYYEHKSGMEVHDGMPSILWIAMGMQEGDKEAGWYNGYSMYVYQDMCSYNSEIAGELGLAEVKARAKEFLGDPAYALDFYFRKFTSQWTEPTYGCFIMTYAAENGRSGFGESLYTGLLNRVLQKYTDSFQLLVYASVLFLLIAGWRQRESVRLEHYILLITVIGGVLFHELWEAKSRYVFPYFMMMLPMAAEGLVLFSACLRKWRTKDEASEGC